MYKSVLTLIILIPFIGHSQPAIDLAAALKKYPDKIGYIEERSMDISVKIDKTGEPKFYITQKDVICTLTDNNASFTSGKEYYGYGYNLKKIEAYTLIPGSKEYSKMKVKEYKKTSEIGDGLFYDDRVAVNFNFPGVCKGAKLIQEILYEVDKAYSPVVNFFGSGLPIEKSYVKISFPEEISIRYKIFGGDSSLIKLTKEKKGGKNIYTWSATDIPNYISETNSPSSRYYIPHLIVTISNYNNGKELVPVFRDLNDLYSWNYQKVKNLFNPNDKVIKAISDSITAGTTEDLEKVKKIFRWVQKNIRYVAIEDGENGFIPRPASLVAHRRYGDCKDKSSLLKALINAQGLDASLVWVGTRDLPYKYTEFPSVIIDNHMVAAYFDKQGNPYILDGTTQNHPIDVIPSFIEGKQCLIEKGEKNYKLYDIPIPEPEKNTLIDSAYLSIQSDTLIGIGHTYSTGEIKVDIIDRFDGVDSDKYKTIVNTILPKGNNKLIVSDVTTSDINNIYDTLRIKYNFKIPNYITKRNGNIYINLNLDKSLQEITIKSDRTQAYEFNFPMYSKNVSVFQIPEGYEIQKLPEESMFQNDKFEFSLKYEAQKNKIILTKQIKLHIFTLNKSDFKAFNEMLTLLNKSYIQTLVLRKK